MLKFVTESAIGRDHLNRRNIDFEEPLNLVNIKLRYMSITARLDEMTEDKEHFQNSVKALPEGLNNAFVLSSYWTQTEVQHDIRIAATISGLVVSNVAFIILLLLTENILVTLVAFQTIAYSVAAEISFLCILDLKSGEIELLTIGLMIGLSASQVIHVATEYSQGATTCEAVKR